MSSEKEPQCKLFDMARKHNVVNGDKHNYQKLSFWSKPENQFWQSPMYSEASKDYFNKWLSNMSRQEKCLANHQSNIGR